MSGKIRELDRLNTGQLSGASHQIVNLLKEEKILILKIGNYKNTEIDY